VVVQYLPFLRVGDRATIGHSRVSPARQRSSTSAAAGHSRSHSVPHCVSITSRTMAPPSLAIGFTLPRFASEATPRRPLPRRSQMFPRSTDMNRSAAGAPFMVLAGLVRGSCTTMHRLPSSQRWYMWTAAGLRAVAGRDILLGASHDGEVEQHSEAVELEQRHEELGRI
jgi:hypothetical protein